MADYNLEKLFDDLLKKKKFDKENSYTSILLNDKNLLAKKIGEESIEVILEYIDNNKNKIIKADAFSCKTLNPRKKSLKTEVVEQIYEDPMS